MKAGLLLDSHALLWSLHDPRRLVARAVEAIRDSRRAVFYSAASAWELEIKVARGKLQLPGAWLDAAEATGFVQLPVRAAEARESAHLPWHHSDPFDRVIIAQAQEHGLTIVTRDEQFAAYDVRILEA